MTTVDLTTPSRRPLPVLGSLSPSRAGDFMTCPLLFRFRTIDRLPQAPSSAATRGTVVHGVLERLFDLPAAGRTLEAATALLRPEWERLREEEPEVAGLFADDAELQTWLDQRRGAARGVLQARGPDPARARRARAARAGRAARRPAPARHRRPARRRAERRRPGRRLQDRAAPGEAFEGKALFQMKFYALVLWRTTGQVPRLLQLMYLGDREVLRYEPDEADLVATERKLLALWEAVERATQRREFLPRPSKLCGWCDHQALCPSFGGTPPPFPDVVPGPDVPLPHQARAVEAEARGPRRGA